MIRREKIPKPLVLVAGTVFYRQWFLAACERLAGFACKAILVEVTLGDS